MFFYHGYALGVASTIPGQEFTEASCGLSIRGGTASAKKSNAPLPPGISFSSADSSIKGWGTVRNGQPVWLTEGSVVVQKLDIHGKFTADRIEAHIYAEWRAGDYEANTVITGSKFDNVQIAGNPTTITVSDALSINYPTYASMEAAFQNSFARNSVLACLEGGDLTAQDASTSDLRAVYDGYQEQKAAAGLKSLVLCSFVTKVTGGGGVKTWGGIVQVPGLGNIYLGEVMVWPWMRCLNLFRIELASGGTLSGASTGTGGNSWP